MSKLNYQTFSIRDWKIMAANDVFRRAPKIIKLFGILALLAAGLFLTGAISDRLGGGVEAAETKNAVAPPRATSSSQSTTLAAQNGRIAFSSNRTGNDEIFTMNSDGTDQINITNNPARDFSPAWSADGSKIVFIRSESGSGNDIYTMNADGSNQIRITTDGNSSTREPRWSPDGTKIAFANFFDIYVMNADGTNLVQLTNNGRYHSSPRFSPDGSKIAFLCSRPFNGTPPGLNDEICLTNADGSNEIILTQHPAADSSPSWSPDGTKIAFSSNRRNGQNDVIVINVDGTNTVNLTANSIGISATPAWSPDGSKIAFWSNRDGAGEIYAMNADGTNPVRVTNNSTNENSPDWQPVVPPAAPFDFDGDGRTDLSVFLSGSWRINPSSANNPNSYYGVQFGLATDRLVPADYDGDGRTDIAVWREEANGSGLFYILQSSTNSLRVVPLGLTGDDPSLVGDWDGDGRSDPAVYRAGTQSVFFYRPSSQISVDYVPVYWGIAGDEALRGDFDGDGRQDAAVFRPSNSVWYIRQSSNDQPSYRFWGEAADKRIEGDFDGDGKTDLATFRDGVWGVLQSSNNQPRFEFWGVPTDRLVPGDYDGDGRTDFAVRRDNVFYILQNAGSQPIYRFFGDAGDIPVASVFVR